MIVLFNRLAVVVAKVEVPTTDSLPFKVEVAVEDVAMTYPNVGEPEAVIVPVPLKTAARPSVPLPPILLLKVLKFALDRYPSVEPFAAGIVNVVPENPKGGF